MNGETVSLTTRIARSYLSSSIIDNNLFLDNAVLPLLRLALPVPQLPPAYPVPASTKRPYNGDLREDL